MADVLSVIADILKQDKQQKREHARMMREVQKKLKEKEVDATEDNADFMGAVAQAAADGKKEFEFPPGSGKMYPVTLKDKSVGKKIAKKMDDEEQEEDMDLGDRVKARMNSQKEDDEPEMDDDDDDAGMSSDQLDKIADLVVQKLKDKAEDEMDDEEEPEPTEAESGKETPVDTKPKMESISRNPHHRGIWAEALRKVYENTQIDEHCGECEESIDEKKGSDYELYHKTFSAAMQHAYAHAKKKGYTVDPDEIDNKVATGPKKPSMGKTNRYILGTDKRQKLHVQVANLDNKRYELNMYIEEVEIDEKFKKGKYTLRDGNTGKVIATYNSGAQAAKEMHKLLDSGKYDELEVKMEEVEIDEKKMFSGKGEFEVKYASSKRGPIKVSKFNTLDDAKKFLAQVKGEGMNGIISKGGKPVKEKLDDEDTPTVKKVVKMLKKASQAHAGQADDLEKSMKEDHHEKDANGEPIPHDDEEDTSIHEADKKTKDRLKMFKKLRDKKASQGFQKTDLANEEIEESDALQMKMAADDIETYAKKHGGIDKKDMMKAASMLKKGDKKGALKFIKTLDTDPRDYLLKTMGEEVEIDEKMDGRKKFSGKQAKKDNEARRAAQRKKLGILGPNEEVEIDEKKSDYEDQIKAFLAKGGKIQKGDRPNKRKIDMVTKGFMKKYGTMKKKEADLDAKDKEELEKMMGEAVVNEAWIDNDAKKIQSKWKKMDKRAKKKWMDGIMAKAKKEGMPKDEVMDVLDDYGLVENFNEESIGIRFVRKHYQKDKESI